MEKGLSRESATGGGKRIALTASRRRLDQQPAAWLLLTPVLLLFSVSVIYPLIETVRLSFFDVRGLGRPTFVGLQNYLTLFADPGFRATMHNCDSGLTRIRMAEYTHCGIII